MDENELVISIGSIQIEYVFQEEQNGQVSKATDITNNICQQHVPSEDLASSLTSSNSVFNIQLNYDINQTLDSEEWDSNFCAISLHSSMEHLSSDIKNIKDFLHRMGKYIKDKSINNSNPNNIKNLEDVGKVVWEFLSSIYNLHWDGLYVDDSNTTFRNKVKSKFIP